MTEYKQKEDISGIYCIENIITGIIYIGSTISFDDRWYAHQWCLKNNRHGNNHLQNAFNKYGIGAFIIFVLETCSEEELIIREQLWLDTFLYSREYIETGGRDKRFKKLGYNLSPTAGRTKGYKHPEEILLKMSKIATDLWDNPEYVNKQITVRTEDWNKRRIERIQEVKNGPRKEEISLNMSIGISNSDYHKSLRKPMLLYNKNTGIFFNEYESFSECSKKTGIHGDRLKLAAKGKIRFTGDYIVRYKTLDGYLKQIEPITTYYKSKEARANVSKCSSERGEAILAYKNDVFIGEYITSADAGRKLGLDPGAIRNVAQGLAMQTKGYTFKYKDPNYQRRKYNKK